MKTHVFLYGFILTISSSFCMHQESSPTSASSKVKGKTVTVEPVTSTAPDSLIRFTGGTDDGCLCSGSVVEIQSRPFVVTTTGCGYALRERLANKGSFAFSSAKGEYKVLDVQWLPSEFPEFRTLRGAANIMLVTIAPVKGASIRDALQLPIDPTYAVGELHEGHWERSKKTHEWKAVSFDAGSGDYWDTPQEPLHPGLFTACNEGAPLFVSAQVAGHNEHTSRANRLTLLGVRITKSTYIDARLFFKPPQPPPPPASQP